MADKYFLNEDHTYRPCGLMEWSNQFETLDRHVAEDNLNDCYISTVWLGFNHNYWGGPPLVFETIVFDSEGNRPYQDRYTTWQEAEEGHQKAIQWVKKGCKDND